VLSIVLGIVTWLFFTYTPNLAAEFPPQLAGLLSAVVGMVLGSLMPQTMGDKKGHVHHYEGSSTT
jgi:solute:Na+ symporter, SSS family